MNRVAMNMCMQGFVQTCLFNSFGYSAGSYGRTTLSCVSSCHTVFHSGCYHFVSPRSMKGSLPMSSMSLPTFGFVCGLDFGHFNRCLEVLVSGYFNLRFPNDIC